MENIHNNIPDTAGAQRSVRYIRDLRLAASDWTQLADNTLSPEQRTAWAQYRQALRDVTQQASFAQTGEVCFPAEPVFND